MQDSTAEQSTMSSVIPLLVEREAAALPNPHVANIFFYSSYCLVDPQFMVKLLGLHSLLLNEVVDDCMPYGILRIYFSTLT